MGASGFVLFCFASSWAHLRASLVLFSSAVINSDPMRFHFSLALSAGLVAAFFQEWRREDLFDASAPLDVLAPLDDSASQYDSALWDDSAALDDPAPLDESALFDHSTSLAQSPPLYAADNPLWDLSPATIATDPALDDTSVGLGCTSTSSGEFMGRARNRRNEEDLCPLTNSVEDAEQFNWERVQRYRIKAIQELANRQARTLSFCPPPLLPLCCVGTQEYLGVSVNDCERCT